MTGFFGGLLVLGSCLVLALSTFALIKPLKSIQLGSRKRALIGIASAALMFLGGGMVLASGGPQPVTPLPPPSRNSSTTNGEDRVDYAADVTAFSARYAGATNACKAAFQRVSDQANSGSPTAQTLFDLASAAKEQCRATSRAVRQLKNPLPLAHSQYGEFLSVMRTCDIAYIGHETTADHLMKAIDGGFRPALVARYRESANEAAGNRRLCEDGIGSASEATIRLEMSSRTAGCRAA